MSNAGINNSDTDSDRALMGDSRPCPCPCPAVCGTSSLARNKNITVAVLCFVNLINYMDRFTIAGVLTDIQDHFKLTDGETGFLQTAFVLSFMIFAPIFGYFGDRHSRNLIMIIGLSIWSVTTLCGSFVDNFYAFTFFRAMVGLGEASYSTIAPTIISDLFVKDQRSKMLAIFYFAIPVGSGLGYIVGSETATLMNSWRWALRVTPVLGLIAVILMIMLLKEPERGEAEGGSHVAVDSYKEDLKDLVKNPSFILSTLGFTCVAFVAGALSWWGPHYVYLGLKLQASPDSVSFNNVSLLFGAVTMLSGIIGVPMGSYLGKMAIGRFKNAHPVICGMGLLLSAPFLGAALYVIENQATMPFVLMFFAELTLNLNWAIVADILLYVVVPTKRSTAEAFQILISHAFGDAGSPYLIGLISEHLKTSYFPHHRPHIAPNVTVTSSAEDYAKFKSLQYALYTTSFVEVLGGMLFLITAFYIVRDKRKVDQVISENSAIQPHNILADDPNVDVESS